jgi:hypothetical protein
MQSIFSNALSEAVAKHINLSATRREALFWLALLIMQHGTISLWRLAAYVASAAQTASVQRRFYRFFQYARLDGTLAARVVVDLLGLDGKLCLPRTSSQAPDEVFRRDSRAWECNPPSAPHAQIVAKMTAVSPAIIAKAKKIYE